jgi:thiamine-phosphate pyrophosphorylase
MASVLRILDANANRAREALRVMEEAARFVLNDGELSEAIKQLRHDLAAGLAPVSGLAAARDTPGDVGTRIAIPTEGRRASVIEVVTAAGKRLSEALRVMEEYGKTLPAMQDAEASGLADRMEALRYRGYDLEQRLVRALGTGRAQQWRVCVLITEALCTDHDWQTVAEQCIAGGADCLQLREKAMPAGVLLQRTRQLVALARPAGVAVIVNDRPDVALLGGADGVHLGQDDLPCDEARRLVGHQLIIGVSTSNLDQARQAQRDGADYCGVGPMFATATKQKDVHAGPGYLKQFVQWGQLPHLAIGGITPETIGELVQVGGQGVAVSSSVCSAADPGAATRQLREQLPD